MTTTVRLVDDPSHQPNSSNTDLGQFHAKYQGNATDNPQLGPLLRYLSQTNGSPQQQRPMRSQRRVQELRAKRAHLRELQELEFKDFTQPRKWANPGPVGLLGFGMTTILLNLHNTGHFKLDTVVPAMGICFGGGAQFIAGLLEWVRGNTFACIAFVSFGSFWLSVICVWMLPNKSFKTWAAVPATSSYFLGSYLVIWGIFSFFMTLCTLRMNVSIFLVFLSVTLLFFLLGGSNMSGSTPGVHAAGYEGVVCGALALYLAFAEILNEVWDRVILPVFPMTQVLGWFAGINKKHRSHADAGSDEEMLKEEELS